LLIQNIDAYVSVLPDQAQRIIDDPGVDLVAFQGLDLRVHRATTSRW